MTTFGLVAKFAGTKYEVNDKNDLQPGDIIICNGIQHVVFYFGNGQTIGCSGGGSGTHGDNPNACVKFKVLYFQTIVCEAGLISGGVASVEAA